MKLLPFTPEKDPSSNNPEKMVKQGMRFRVFASVAVLEGVHARLYAEDVSEKPVLEELDVSQLEVPADVDTVTQYTAENTSQLSRAASNHGQIYDKDGLWRGGSN